MRACFKNNWIHTAYKLALRLAKVGVQQLNLLEHNSHFVKRNQVRLQAHGPLEGFANMPLEQRKKQPSTTMLYHGCPMGEGFLQQLTFEEWAETEIGPVLQVRYCTCLGKSVIVPRLLDG